MLGTLGALDPHTFKTKHASHQGEGLLEQEGVRPHRPGPTALPVSTVTGELQGALQNTTSIVDVFAKILAQSGK